MSIACYLSANSRALFAPNRLLSECDLYKICFMTMSQVAIKNEANAQELDAHRKYDQQLAESRAREVEQEKLEQMLYKKRQRNDLQALQDQVKEEARERFANWQENMDTIDCKIHKQVASGSQRGFTTLPAVKSC